METPLKITFQDIESSESIEALIREKVVKLEHLYGRITGCRVAVQRQRARGHQGHLFEIHVEVVVPGRPEIVVSRDPGRDRAHEDVRVAIRDAFDAAGRRLQDHVRRRGGITKEHEAPPHGRISQVFHTKDHGFIRATGGEDVYFHRNAVVGAEFDDLAVGTEVRYAVAEGESAQGPQATTVTPVGKHHLLD